MSYAGRRGGVIRRKHSSAVKARNSGYDPNNPRYEDVHNLKYATPPGMRAFGLGLMLMPDNTIVVAGS